ncbi:hypothetical protein [Rhizorhabdus sp.]|uniref:hypothetical protein n=1 Tax=Rhizorhabdus sp. TaxID=1968843 RepID=UPI0019AD6D9B|nr:hypothetical protein [Rhizorhabdus sp.]MBD3762479.1 hypothetical protein [Rhizorhabdus sp.]
MSQPPCNEHRLDVYLLGFIALVVGALAGIAFWKGNNEGGAGFAAVFMAIIAAIKERWTQRSLDRMSAQLQQSAPAPPEPTRTEVEQ